MVTKADELSPTPHTLDQNVYHARTTVLVLTFAKKGVIF